MRMYGNHSRKVKKITLKLKILHCWMLAMSECYSQSKVLCKYSDPWCETQRSMYHETYIQTLKHKRGKNKTKTSE